MIRIAIIIGSTRPGRKGEAVAKWVYEIARKRTEVEFELVDIKDLQSAAPRRTDAADNAPIHPRIHQEVVREGRFL